MPKNSNIFLKLLVFVFILFCGVTIIKMQFEVNALEEEKLQIEAEIKEVRLSNDKLQSQIDEQFDKDTIMRLATEKLNLHKEGEIIFYNNITK